MELKYCAKNSPLLAALIERAASYTKNTLRAPTSIGFVLAILDLVLGNFAPEPENEESAQLIRAVAGLDINAEKAKEALEEELSSEKTDLYDDAAYFEGKLTLAVVSATASELDTVSAVSVLENIVSDPDEAIKDCLEKCSEKLEENRSEGATSEELESFSRSIEKSFDRLFAKNGGNIFDLYSDIDLPEVDDEEPSEELVSESKIRSITARVRKIQKKLLENVYGQDHAVAMLASGYFRGELASVADSDSTKPRATYLFAGPPGVGKTYLAKCAAAELGLPFCRFDMSEYCDKESALEFLGSDKVYQNAGEGNFTSFVEKNPKCVILFDEIEKAHSSIINLFLQILDAGRIRDSYTDREISLKDAVLIFTTNAGKDLYDAESAFDGSAIPKKAILSALGSDRDKVSGEPYFPAAICSRFAGSNVVMFNRMKAADLWKIAERAIRNGIANLTKEFGINVELDENVISAVLFAAGGLADARTVESQAVAFLHDELLELFRLADARDGEDGRQVSDITDIKISVDLSEADEIIKNLFKPKEKPEILAFGCEDSVFALDICNVIPADTACKAREILKKENVTLTLINVGQDGERGEEEYLSPEDGCCECNELLRYAKRNYPHVPVYLTKNSEKGFSDEQMRAYLAAGASGFIGFFEDKSEFAQEIAKCIESIHRQRSMKELARSQKVLTYESAQKLSADGSSAEIKLYMPRLEIAKDPEDITLLLSDASRPCDGFDSVIGAKEAKKELKYFANYLSDPKKYAQSGVRSPRGVLLYGPSGTGKTLLAKAMAGACNVPFICAEGNRFLGKYVGDGQRAIHELFRKARKYAPSILFIDEIDAIAKERHDGDRSGASDTLTALLTEMDGFASDPTRPVFLLAATNYGIRPGGRMGCLDPSILRRFDRKIYIDLPTKEDRTLFMKKKTKNNSLFAISSGKLEDLSVRSTGMTLAELESVFELSLRTALIKGVRKVGDDVLEEAFESYSMGERKNVNGQMLERIAIHESGHAYLSWIGGARPAYVSIVPRGDLGGYVQSIPGEDAIRSKKHVLSQIRTALGGRAAETVFYGESDGPSTGAASDLANATDIAFEMVCTFGMDEGYGLIVTDMDQAKADPDARAAVKRILSAQMEEALKQVTGGKEAIKGLAAELLTKNHLSEKEISTVLERYLQ